METLERCVELAHKSISPIIERSLANLGENPVIYLDSGAIISFEKIINTLRKASASRFDASQFYKIFQDLCPSTFVTSYVLSEVDRHYKHTLINGTPEISGETMDSITKMHQDCCAFVREAEHQRNFDDIRHDVFWAGSIAFPHDHKKCNGDCISLTDRDLISSSLDTAYSKGITGVAVITTDSHISRTIDVLTGQHLAAIDNYLNVINPALQRYPEDSATYASLSSPPTFDYEHVNVLNLLEGKR